MSRVGRGARLLAEIRVHWYLGARSRAGRSQPFRKAALESGRQRARRITHFALFVVPVALGSRCLLLSGGDGRREKHEIFTPTTNSQQNRKNKNQKKKNCKKKKKSERDIQSRSNK